MEKENKIKIILLEPGKMARVEEIENTLEAKQKIVGGYIEATYPFEGPACVVCNEDGKNIGLEQNRALCDDNGNVYDFLFGTAFICGINDEDFASLTDEQIDRYMKLYMKPQRLVRINERLCIIPY